MGFLAGGKGITAHFDFGQGPEVQHS